MALGFCSDPADFKGACEDLVLTNGENIEADSSHAIGACDLAERRRERVRIGVVVRCGFGEEVTLDVRYGGDPGLPGHGRREEIASGRAEVDGRDALRCHQATSRWAVISPVIGSFEIRIGAASIVPMISGRGSHEGQLASRYRRSSSS